MTLQPIVTGHEDIIHDLAFDFYGRAFATCSADRTIKVFFKNTSESTQKWVLRDSWKAHESAIVKVCWAPPEYGQILASVSFDGTIKFWEHLNDAQSESGRCFKSLYSLTSSNGNTNEAPLFDISFAPGFMDHLKFAAIGSDGIVKIYECLSLADLSEWNLIQSLEIGLGTTDSGASGTVSARNLPANFTINWCQSKFSSEKICVSALNQCVLLTRDARLNMYKKSVIINDHKSLINDVCWAPCMGRSYDLLATGSKDGFVRIYKVTDKFDAQSLQSRDESDSNNSAMISASKLQVQSLMEQGDHKDNVWSVSWNSTGTILSSTGDDGMIRFWKSTRKEEFRCVAKTLAH